MSLLVKDANTQTQPLSTQLDVAGNLVPVHVPASVINGIATPVSTAAPLPVEVAAGSPAVDGSGTITTGGTAQTLFGGITPSNGFLVANNSSQTLYLCDVGIATAGGASVPVPQGTVYTTPPGYKPAGQVSIFGASTAQAFAARRW